MVDAAPRSAGDAVTTPSGWTLAVREEPPRGVLLRFRLESTGDEWTGRVDARSIPLLRDPYLAYKLTAIGKMQMEAQHDRG
jgi:hypothetical protein